MKERARLLALLPLLLALAEGLMVVSPGESAVVFRLGRPARVTGAGLALRLPWPVESDQRVNIAEVRRASLGRRRLLTADTNLVDVELVAQYQVSDPLSFLVGAAAPEELLVAAASASSAAVVATMDVDSLLTTGRADLERRAQESTQQVLDRAGCGLRVVAVEVADLGPPPAVLEAFNDVSSARGDRETLALAAEAFASTVVPAARGEAAARVESARARATARRSGAAGDVERMRALAGSPSAEAQLQRRRAEAWTAIGGALRRIQATPGSEVRIDPPTRTAEPP
jgi:modulator of FtsH protease HflK